MCKFSYILCTVLGWVALKLWGSTFGKWQILLLNSMKQWYGKLRWNTVSFKLHSKKLKLLWLLFCPSQEYGSGGPQVKSVLKDELTRNSCTIINGQLDALYPLILMICIVCIFLVEKWVETWNVLIWRVQDSGWKSVLEKNKFGSIKFKMLFFKASVLRGEFIQHVKMGGICFDAVIHVVHGCSVLNGPVEGQVHHSSFI